eukprot:RCo047806
MIGNVLEDSAEFADLCGGLRVGTYFFLLWLPSHASITSIVWLWLVLQLRICATISEPCFNAYPEKIPAPVFICSSTLLKQTANIGLLAIRWWTDKKRRK